MSLGFSIRPAVLADSEAIAAIYAYHVHHGTGTFALEPPTVDEMAQTMEAVLSTGRPYFVAIIDDKIIGYAYGNQFRPRPGYAHSLETSIYVDPKYQGQGIGKDLLAHVVKEAPKSGAKQLLAIIGDSENLGSIGIHKALGFYHVGTMKDVGFKFGRYLDVVVMQLAV